MASEPDRTVRLEFLDVRPVHGVLVGVVIDGDGDAERARSVAQGEVRLPARLAIARKNELAVFLEVDQTLTRILGWAPDDLVGRRSLELVHPDDHERAIGAWMEMLERPETPERVRLRHLHQDGSWVWMELTNHNRLAAEGCVVTEMIDISDEMAMQEALRLREELLRRITESVPVGLLEVDGAGRVLYGNPQLARMLGTPIAATAGEQFASLAGDGWQRVKAGLVAVAAGVDGDVEVRVQRAGGDVRHCVVSFRALVDIGGGGPGAIVMVADATDSVRLRQELDRRATHDMLTDCLNRGAIDAALATVVAAGGPTAVAFVDLDGFKAVNDELGHAAGDDVLQHAASRLRDTVRSGDLVGRFGGDEFVVVCPDVRDASEAERLARRITGALDAEIDVGPGHALLRASVGMAWTPAASDAAALVAAADRAMYAAKALDRGVPVVVVESDPGAWSPAVEHGG